MELELYLIYAASRPEMSRAVCTHLLEVYTNEIFPVSRARVLVQLAQLYRASVEEERGRELLLEALELSKNSYENNQVGEEKELADQPSLLADGLACVYSWLAILEREAFSVDDDRWEDSINKALSFWEQLFLHLDIPHSAVLIDRNLAHFHAPHDTLALLEQLGDLFDLLGELDKQLTALKLIAALHERVLVREKSSQQALIVTFAKIGTVYQRRGLTDTASYYFERVQQEIAKAPHLSLWMDDSSVTEDDEDTSDESNEETEEEEGDPVDNLDWILVSSQLLYETGRVASIRELKSLQFKLLRRYLANHRSSPNDSIIIVRFSLLLARLYERQAQVMRVSCLRGLFIVTDSHGDFIGVRSSDHALDLLSPQVVFRDRWRHG